MIAASRSARPSVSTPSPLVEVLPPPVSGAPTGALRVLVGVGDDGFGDDGLGDDGLGDDGLGDDGLDDDGLDDDPVVRAVAVGEPSAMTGDDADAEVVTVGLLDEFAVVVLPPTLLQKASSNRTKMMIARRMARIIPVRRRLEPDPAVSGALSDIAESPKGKERGASEERTDKLWLGFIAQHDQHRAVTGGDLRRAVGNRRTAEFRGRANDRWPVPGIKRRRRHRTPSCCPTSSSAHRIDLGRRRGVGVSARYRRREWRAPPLTISAYADSCADSVPGGVRHRPGWFRRTGGYLIGGD